VQCNRYVFGGGGCAKEVQCLLLDHNVPSKIVSRIDGFVALVANYPIVIWKNR
jgi:hypothetical protein